MQKRAMTIERFRVYVQRLDTSALPDNIRNRLKDLAAVPLIVAVTGDSGVGKSSFINTLRNLTPDDPKAAPVGVVEKTTKRSKYIDPKYPERVYWDLPGCGTPSFPRETYLDKVGFDEYDFFLIVSSNRFKENDAWLAEEITKRKREFFFVRNKIDIDVHNERRDHPKRNETEILDQIRKNCVQNLRTSTKSEVQVYLISSVLSEKNKWDFTRLVDDSIRETIRLKQELLINQLKSFSLNEIIKGATKLRSEIFWLPLVAALLDLVPFPFISLIFQMYHVEKKTAEYKAKLLLDEDWLLSLITTQPSHFPMISSSFFGQDNIQYYLTQLSLHLVLYISKWLLQYLSENSEPTASNPSHMRNCIIFQLIAAATTYVMVLHRLESLVDDLEHSALNLIDRFV
jgi:predicted GTPase